MSYPAEPFNLFAYGTLQRGGRYHARYATGYRSCVAASIWGRLYELPQGYPMLVVPDETVIAQGTKPVTLDSLQHGVGLETPPSSVLPRPAGDWQCIRGELFEFDDPHQRFAELDELEGFHAPGPSLYDRVLLWVDVDSVPCVAWTYVAPQGQVPDGARRYERDKWPSG